MTGMHSSVPGEGTSIQYAGPHELRTELPARSAEQAMQVTRDLLSRAAEQVADAESSVSRLGRDYPSSFGHTIQWLRGQNLAALHAAQGSDPFAALETVRRIATGIAETSNALILSARGISSRMKPIADGRINQ